MDKFDYWQAQWLIGDLEDMRARTNLTPMEDRALEFLLGIS